MLPAPVQPHQRIHYLDILRGLAITGVLTAYVFWNLGTAPQATWTRFDRDLDQVLLFLVDSKCFTVLANLFAVGFVLHMNKAKEQGKSLYTYRRRLAGLMVLGLIHALVLRNGDILLPYALLMFLVSFFYSASVRVLVTAMVTCFLLEALMPDLYRWMNWTVPVRPQGNSNYLIDNFQWVRYWYSSAPLYWETTLLFLFSGLLLGRLFIRQKASWTPGVIGLVLAAGLLAGSLSYWVAGAYGDRLAALGGGSALGGRILHNLLMLLHRAGLASAYASLVFLLSRRFSLAIFATLGRTSLTNYIVQAVVVVPLCLAMDWFDRITPTLALSLTASIWIVQVVSSTWWLNRHRFGPLEWVLRRFTYGKSIVIRQPAGGQSVRPVSEAV